MPHPAETFRQLHRHGLLRLANAWDAGTARLIESLGAPAVATTSAGLAWSCGYADGDRLPVTRLLAAVEAILRVLRVPLSVDVEGGYSDDPAQVAGTVLALAKAGVAGINLEDADAPPERLAGKIRHIRQACREAGADVFINARTDVHLRGLAPEGVRVQAVLERAALYEAAGADGLFVPGLTIPDEIGAIASQARLPLNVMLRPGLPAPDALEALGVRRLSAGSALAESMYGLVRRQARDFMQDRTRVTVDPQAMDYAEINGLFADRHPGPALPPDTV